MKYTPEEEAVIAGMPMPTLSEEDICQMATTEAIQEGRLIPHPDENFHDN